MTEYRIGDLAAASGVNARNIRAYRERGLLDPPLRVGRAAVYADVHLAQLRVINQLLSKQFTSSHIADFFSAMRSGHDLADILGLHAVFADDQDEKLTALPLDIEMTRGEARRMVSVGVACIAGGQLMLIDPELVKIVARAPNRRRYLATIVDVFASTQEGIAAAAEDVDSLLEEAAAELVTTDVVRHSVHVPPIEPVRVLQDYRELAAIIIARQVEQAVRNNRMRPSA